MKFEEWEPLYTRILEDFGFDREKDELAALYLQSIIPRDNIDVLEQLCMEGTITVCGNSPSLIDELDGISGILFAADGAASRLFELGIQPDAVFTDLDGADERFPEMNRAGTLMVVHAHGDNMPLLEFWVPQFEGPFVATTQSRPIRGVYNFGGFSDGDRAVFAAHALGARSVSIVGFDLDDTSVDPVKREKLRWARTLLSLLGHDL
jgi:uncharacterized Rossmann fold enzyme